MINTLIAKLAVLAAAALPEYTTVDEFYTSPREVDGGAHPRGMIYDPTVGVVRKPNKQRQNTITLLALLVRDPGESTEMRNDLEAFVEALEADSTLTGSVDDAFAETYGSAERQSAHTTGGLIIKLTLVD